MGGPSGGAAVAFICLAIVPLEGGSGASVPVGFVVISSDTNIAGNPAMIGQTVLLGDRVDTGAGAARISLGASGEVVLGPGTVLSFAGPRTGVTILLDRGDLSLLSISGAHRVDVRAANVSARPACQLRTRWLVKMRDDSLTIAARDGEVLVDADGARWNVPGGRALRFLADRDLSDVQEVPRDDTGAQNSTAQMSPGVHWGRVALCAAAGAALGSLPVIVSENSVSADPGWRWGLIPIGAIGGGLICAELKQQPAPPPAAGPCNLTANGDEAVSFTRAGNTPKIAWTLPKGVTGKLACTLTGLGDVLVQQNGECPEFR